MLLSNARDSSFLASGRCPSLPLLESRAYVSFRKVQRLLAGTNSASAVYRSCRSFLALSRVVVAGERGKKKSVSAGGVVKDGCPPTLAQVTAKEKGDVRRTNDVVRIGARSPIPGEILPVFEIEMQPNTFSIFRFAFWFRIRTRTIRSMLYVDRMLPASWCGSPRSGRER